VKAEPEARAWVKGVGIWTKIQGIGMRYWRGKQGRPVQGRPV